MKVVQAKPVEPERETFRVVKGYTRARASKTPQQVGRGRAWRIGLVKVGPSGVQEDRGEDGRWGLSLREGKGIGEVEKCKTATRMKGEIMCMMQTEQKKQIVHFKQYEEQL